MERKSGKLESTLKMTVPVYDLWYCFGNVQKEDNIYLTLRLNQLMFAKQWVLETESKWQVYQQIKQFKRLRALITNSNVMQIEIKAHEDDLIRKSRKTKVPQM